MKKARYSEDQMVRILREADQIPVAQVAKKYGVSEATIYAWRKKYGELDVTDIRHMKRLEQENARLKKLLAERDLEIEVMKEVSKKKVHRGIPGTIEVPSTDTGTYVLRPERSSPHSPGTKRNCAWKELARREVGLAAREQAIWITCWQGGDCNENYISHSNKEFDVAEGSGCIVECDHLGSCAGRQRVRHVNRRSKRQPAKQ